MIAEEGVAELKRHLNAAYRIAQDLQDLQDQDVELVGVESMHSIRVDLWAAIQKVGSQQEALSRDEHDSSTGGPHFDFPVEGCRKCEEVDVS